MCRNIEICKTREQEMANVSRSYDDQDDLKVSLYTWELHDRKTLFILWFHTRKLITALLQGPYDEPHAFKVSLTHMSYLPNRDISSCLTQALGMSYQHTDSCSVDSHPASISNLFCGGRTVEPRQWVQDWREWHSVIASLSASDIK